jgi:hypothetical protein
MAGIHRAGARHLRQVSNGQIRQQVIAGNGIDPVENERFGRSNE